MGLKKNTKKKKKSYKNLIIHREHRQILQTESRQNNVYRNNLLKYSSDTQTALVIALQQPVTLQY